MTVLQTTVVDVRVATWLMVDDLIDLIGHLLVLFEEVWVHRVVLGMHFVLTVVNGVHMLVCLPVFFIKLSDRWIEHNEWHVIVLLLLLTGH